MPRVKNKERILQAAREKERVPYKGVPIRLSADFSKESLQANRAWKEVIKVHQTTLQGYCNQNSLVLA